MLDGKGRLSIFISQSGETADTLAALKYAKSKKSKILSLVNVTESSIARESDYILSIAAGPEIGVASTKAFTAQLSILACLCIVIARDKKTISKKMESFLTESMIEVPSNMSSALELSESIKKISAKLIKAKSVLFLDRTRNRVVYVTYNTQQPLLTLDPRCSHRRNV